MNSNLRYEIKALAFQKLTGILAPGKDEAAANPSGLSPRERMEAWDRFIEEEGATVNAVLDAVDELVRCFSSNTDRMNMEMRNQNEPRQICSPENPMPKGATGRWAHTNAHEVGGQRDGWPGGDIVRMRCEDCGHEWEMELPQ